MNKNLFIGCVAAWLVLLIVLTTLRTVNAIDFTLNCKQYLKRAADANTIELAAQNLDKAIDYAEKHNLTNGIVSIFLHQPENDIGFWYSNLKAGRNELSIIRPEASQLEKSNILMKLRETLVDHGSNRVSVTCPEGISIYPYNALFFWLYLACNAPLVILIF